MGTQPDHPLGYSAKALDRWAERVHQWSAGGTPEGLDRFAPPTGRAPRDVFLYVISGHKPLNPRAATALIERL